MPFISQLCLTIIQSIKKFSTWLYQHGLTKLVWHLSHCQWTWLKNRIIQAFISHFQPNMLEAELTDPFEYVSFNALFTRKLKANARPLEGDEQHWLSPADGTLSQLQFINDGQLIQAKQHTYTCAALLGNHPEWQKSFNQGISTTIYLAPFDYHRVHMPLSGRLRCMMHIPGNLYSVSLKTAAKIPNLFAKNERVVCIFDTNHGPLAIALIGATLVGSIEISWHGLIRPKGHGKITQIDYPADTGPYLQQGELMGWFNYGSTVVCLLNNESEALHPWSIPCSIRYGQRLADLS